MKNNRIGKRKIATVGMFAFASTIIIGGGYWYVRVNLIHADALTPSSTLNVINLNSSTNSSNTTNSTPATDATINTATPSSTSVFTATGNATTPVSVPGTGTTVYMTSDQAAAIERLRTSGISDSMIDTLINDPASINDITIDSDGTYRITSSSVIATYNPSTGIAATSTDGEETWIIQSPTAEQTAAISKATGVTFTPGKPITLTKALAIKSGIAGQSLSVSASKTTTAGNYFNAGDSISAYVKNLYDWALVIGAGLAVIMIMWSGYTYITALGDPERIRSAKDYLIGALMGLALLILTATIARTLGLKSLEGTGNATPGTSTLSTN